MTRAVRIAGRVLMALGLLLVIGATVYALLLAAAETQTILEARHG